jgi:hypothetical protein
MSLTLLVPYRTTWLRVNSLNNVLEKNRIFSGMKIIRQKYPNLSVASSQNTPE